MGEAACGSGAQRDANLPPRQPTNDPINCRVTISDPISRRNPTDFFGLETEAPALVARPILVLRGLENNDALVGQVMPSVRLAWRARARRFLQPQDSVTPV